jgi:hypothetical protein
MISGAASSHLPSGLWWVVGVLESSLTSSVEIRETRGGGEAVEEAMNFKVPKIRGTKKLK